jgi:hypothetical protein
MVRRTLRWCRSGKKALARGAAETWSARWAEKSPGLPATATPIGAQRQKDISQGDGEAVRYAHSHSLTVSLVAFYLRFARAHSFGRQP